jgi:hypothetical protein
MARMTTTTFDWPDDEPRISSVEEMAEAGGFALPPDTVEQADEDEADDGG